MDPGGRVVAAFETDAEVPLPLTGRWLKRA
jgi:hypothetical protein